jgi:hypothetical protein
VTNRPEVPEFGRLLREHIQSVPAEAQPAFLAGLERSAAERYRQWADALPEWQREMLDCARREDEIATIVSDLFPVSDEHQRVIDEALPGAVDVYYEVFEPFSAHDQLYLQSEAEIQGSMAWVRLAENIDNEQLSTALARCTELELESSRAVKALLEEPSTT